MVGMEQTAVNGIVVTQRGEWPLQNLSDILVSLDLRKTQFGIVREFQPLIRLLN